MWLLLALSLGVATGLGYGLLLPEPLETFNHAETQTKFSYKGTIKAEQLTDDDTAYHIIFRGSPGQGVKDQFLITLRYEEDIRQAAALAGIEPIQLILSNAGKAFPQRFPDYRQVSVRRLEQAGRTAAEVIFEYKGTTGEIIKQRLLIIMKDDDTAFYLAAQATAAEYATVEQEYFRPSFETLTFN